MIPRLLRAGDIKPVLIHGDLWSGNVAIDKKTNKPLLFDAACIYGHKECESSLLFLLSLRKRKLSSLYNGCNILGEFQAWWAPYLQLTPAHVKAYDELGGVSDPVEEHDDRQLLYSM